jgi:hypothetical protein
MLRLRGEAGGGYTLPMSASDSPALGAIAYQLSSALDAYEGEVDRLLQAHFDPELYRRVSLRMDEMRLYAASFPRLSSAWVEVLIRHAALTHGIWRSTQPGQQVDFPELRCQLHSAVQRLQQKCMMLLPSA